MGVVFLASKLAIDFSMKKVKRTCKATRIARSESPSIGSTLNKKNTSEAANNSDHLLVPMAASDLLGDHHGEDSQHESYLVHLTLRSGHDLAIRDRSGTSDPYVKMKHGKFKCRSSTVYSNLNPVWNETFVFETKNLTLPVIIRVYDRDVVSSDDFMGSGSINLNHRTINNNDEIKVELNDPAVDEQLGYLKFTIKVMPSTSHDQSDDNVDLNVKQYNNDKAKNPTCWDSVLTVTVLEAKNLPAMDHNGLSDPYCKFKLGSQKYKTKVIHKTLNPDWKEQFDMKLYNQKDKTLKVQVWDRDFPSTDDFIGECKIDLTKYNANHTYNLMLKLENTSMDITATLHLMLVISGLTGQEQDPSVSEHIMSNSNKNCYQIWNTWKLSEVKDIGLLHITIEKADDLRNCSSGNQVNSYATVEVGNDCLRTQTIPSTPDPNWERTFSFPISDIHNCVIIVIYNITKYKEERIGQVIIPILRLETDGESKTYPLKDVNYLQRVPGTVTLRTNLVYNPIRAGLHTIKPREALVLEEEPRFQRKLLLKNINRCLDLVAPVMRVRQIYRDIISWQDPARSILAVLVYIFLCIVGEIWMFFLIIVAIFMLFYAKIWVEGDNSHLRKTYHIAAQLAFSENKLSESDFSDLEDYEPANKEKSISWRKYLRQLQEILLLVQINTGLVADLSERAINLLHWTVPFLCWMAVFVCLGATFTTYFIPLRLIALVLGLYILTKKLWRPHVIPNNELLDFLSRAPTNLELLQWKELSIK